MNVSRIDNFWIIEETVQYDPSKINDVQEKQDIIKWYVDDYIKEFIGGRKYEEGLVIISGENDKLSKVSSPVIESFFNHLDKTYHIRYARSIKII